jgi:hypothetical protein
VAIFRDEHRRSSSTTRVVSEFTDADRYHQVPERNNGVKWLREQDSVSEKGEQITSHRLPMLHGLFNGLEDSIAMRIVADRLCRHPKIQSNHERVHCHPDRDNAEAAGRDVGYAEGEN